MNIERTLGTQRHRLLRILAGLVVLIEILAIGPVSRRFSDWTLEFAGPVLSRLEAAVRYMVMTQACLMVDRCDINLDRSQIGVTLVPEWNSDETATSVAEYRRRLRVLRAVLMDLPRHALRLLRRIAKQALRIERDVLPRFDLDRLVLVCGWRHAVPRIERPPDKGEGGGPVSLTSPRVPGGRRRLLSNEQVSGKNI